MQQVQRSSVYNRTCEKWPFQGPRPRHEERGFAGCADESHFHEGGGRICE